MEIFEIYGNVGRILEHGGKILGIIWKRTEKQHSIYIYIYVYTERERERERESGREREREKEIQHTSELDRCVCPGGMCGSFLGMCGGVCAEVGAQSN